MLPCDKVLRSESSSSGPEPSGHERLAPVKRLARAKLSVGSVFMPTSLEKRFASCSFSKEVSAYADSLAFLREMLT